MEEEEEEDNWSSGRGRSTVQLDINLFWALPNASCNSSDHAI